MSRNCNNLNVPPCCLLEYSIPCSVICCTPPVSYPRMPNVPRIQCRIAHQPQPTPKPTKAVVYLPPCPSCPMSNPPKMEVTYLPPSSPPSPPCFYVSKTNCVPVSHLAQNPQSCEPHLAEYCAPLVSPVKKQNPNWQTTDNYATACKDEFM